MSTFIIVYVGLIPLFSWLSLLLIGATILVWSLFLAVLLIAIRRANRVEGVSNE